MHLVRALTENGPQAGANVPAQTAVSDTAGLILAANPKRKGLTIQNAGTTIIKLVFGTTTPTSSVYHVALKAGTGANDGLGGLVTQDGWIGAVWAISSAAGGLCQITETTCSGPDWDRAADWGLT